MYLFESRVLSKYRTEEIGAKSTMHSIAATLYYLDLKTNGVKGKRPGFLWQYTSSLTDSKDDDAQWGGEEPWNYWQIGEIDLITSKNTVLLQMPALWIGESKKTSQGRGLGSDY